MASLHEAARRGDVAGVQAGLQAGVNPDLRDGWYENTALHCAAEKGHVAVVGALVGGGAAVGAEAYFGNTALHYAAYNGHAAVVGALAGAGAGVDAAKNDGDTPLSLAFKHGKTEAAAALLGAGADATRPTAEGKTAAEWARQQGHPAVAQLIEDHLAAPKAAVAKPAQSGFCSTGRWRCCGGSHLAAPKAATQKKAAPKAKAKAGAGGTRMHSDVETALSTVPKTDWSSCDPGRSCLDELLANLQIRAQVPRIDAMVDDFRVKASELRFTPVPVKLDESCTVAIVAYTHDLNMGTKRGNLYFELNTMLRKRGAVERSQLVTTWGGYMFYMMKGLAQLPDFRGTCWRGYNHGSRAEILHQYQLGRPIQWGAFTSVTTSLAAAKDFAPQSRVVFKISVTSGRNINAYSFFPQEGEILLSPAHRFTVSSEPREEGGFTFIDLVQMDGNTFVS